MAKETLRPDVAQHNLPGENEEKVCFSCSVGCGYAYSRPCGGDLIAHSSREFGRM
jgi:hypothetical protein